MGFGMDEGVMVNGHGSTSLHVCVGETGHWVLA